MNKKAVKVGNVFVITDKLDHLDLTETILKVKVDEIIYNLYKGATFEVSRLIDKFIDDNNLIQYRIKNYLV